MFFRASAPGQGPGLRNAIERETGHADRSWPGGWFFGAILLLFFILIPIFVAWDFISPRTFREFNYATHPVLSQRSIAARGRFRGPIRHGPRSGMKVPFPESAPPANIRSCVTA